MKEIVTQSFTEQMKAAGDRKNLLKSNVFTPRAKEALKNNERAKVVIMVEPRKNNADEDLKNLLGTLELAKKEEHIIYEADNTYTTVKVDATSDVIAFLPHARPEITEIYMSDSHNQNEKDTNTTYMDTYSPSSIPAIWV